MFGRPAALRRRSKIAPLLAGTSLGLVLAAGQVRAAQDDGPVEEITVTGRVTFAAEQATLPQLTQPLLETPQSITVLTEAELEDRAIADLNVALRNVPGISLGAGEFSWQGNSPTIRGFAARSDMFLDGMRDFGNYYRDAFNIAQLEVLQGPSSIYFGRGSTGGVINQSSKKPYLADAATLTLAGGTDETKRAVADLNKTLGGLGEGSAARLVGMWHRSETAGRNVAENARYGIASSLAMGLGTPARLEASFLHQSEDNIPDYGIPWYFGRSAPVPRATFYGHTTDRLDTEANVGTAQAAHDLNSNVTLNAKLRYAHYSRDFRITEAVLAPGTTPQTPLDEVMLNLNIWSGSGVETALLGQIDVAADFATGGFMHTLVAGIDGGRETSAPVYRNSLGVPDVPLIGPDPSRPFVSSNTFVRLAADTTGKSFAFFAVDTIDLAPKWELTGGARWDYFSADYSSINYFPDGAIEATDNIVQTERMPSWRAAIVYKAAENGTFYASTGTSFNPSAESLTQIVAGRRLDPDVTTGNANLDPEENQTFEIGTKWDMLADALSLSAAIFRLEKNNARVPDLTNPGFNMLGGKHRVDGFQIQAVGLLTPQLLLNAGYTYLDSEVVTTVPGAAAAGRPLINTPKHSLTFFAEYSLPFGLDLGFGAQYQSERLAQNAGAVPLKAASHWVLEAMAAYQLNEHIAFQLNVYNLADAYYLEQLHPWHVVPGAGRSALLSVKLAN